MTRLRLLPATTPAALVLVVTFVLGGLVAPDLHRAAHVSEWAAERTAHVADHHDGHETDGGDALDVPCAPAGHTLDCALCHVVTSSLLTLDASIVAPDLGDAARPDEPVDVRRNARFAAPSRGPPAAALA